MSLPSAKPLLRPHADPGSFKTDGRQHDPIGEAWSAFEAALGLDDDAPPEEGFSPLGQGLEVRHG